MNTLPATTTPNRRPASSVQRRQPCSPTRRPRTTLSATPQGRRPGRASGSTLDAVSEHAYELVHPDADSDLERLAAIASLEDAADARAAREAMAEIEAGAPTIPLARIKADLGL